MTLIVDLSPGSEGTTLADLRTILKDRWGFQDYTPSECNRLLNRAYRSICESEDWPFLEADASGSAPLTVSDLRKVDTVRDTATGAWLERTSRRRIITLDLDPATTGTPEAYYIDAGTIVRTYPVGGTVAVRYWKVPPALASSADTPIIPERFREVIVLKAARMGMSKESAAEDWQIVNTELSEVLGEMRDSLLEQHEEPDEILTLQPWYDGGF